MTTMELIERGIGHNCLSDAYELGRQDVMNDDGVPAQLLEMGYKKGRADAIDEFVKAIKDNVLKSTKPTWMGYVEEVAEQLKEQK